MGIQYAVELTGTKFCLALISDLNAHFNFAHLKHVARRLEAAKFDAFSMDDHPGLPRSANRFFPEPRG